MNELMKLSNIGEVLADKLIKVGIDSYDKLVELGSVSTVIRIGETDTTACYNMLYALEGAIRGVRWHAIPKEDRKIIKDEFDELV